MFLFYAIGVDLDGAIAAADGDVDHADISLSASAAVVAGLFVVTAAFARTGLPGVALDALAGHGVAPDRLAVMAPLTLAGSNTIGNVPLVMLLLAVVPDWPPMALTALAVLATLAGNLLVVGSLANIIAVARARQAGVVIGFGAHARAGIPMTLAGMITAMLWFWGIGGLPL